MRFVNNIIDEINNNITREGFTPVSCNPHCSAERFELSDLEAELQEDEIWSEASRLRLSSVVSRIRHVIENDLDKVDPAGEFADRFYIF